MAKENPLFIEGMLFPNQLPKIFVSKSSPFFSSEVTPQAVFARGAEVTITEGTTVNILQEDSIFNKARCRWEPFYRGNFLPQIGNTYRLDITFQGKPYNASTTLNQKMVNIESIEYTPEFFDVYGGHDGVIINIKDPVGVDDNYRFRMDRMIDTSVYHAHVLDGFINNCTQPGELFRVEDIGRVVFSDEKVDGQNIEMYIEVSYEYSEGDEGWVFIQSIDKNYSRILS